MVKVVSPWKVTGPAKIDSNWLDAPPITVSLSVRTTSENVSIVVFSSPTRLVLLANDIAENIKVAAKEVKGPKIGSPNQVIQGFVKAKKVSEQDLIEKDTDKGKFYFIKTQPNSILVEELLSKIIPKAISSISWKKSMKWSDHNLMWGRPLQSIFARFNNKKLSFNFDHLETTDKIIVEQDLIVKSRKINNFKEYLSFLKTFNIIVDHDTYCNCSNSYQIS